MARVVGLRQRFVQLAHQARSLLVRRALPPIEARPHAEDEGERLDVVFQVSEPERPFAPFIQVEQVPALEIAGEDVTRALRLRQPVVVIQRLVAGALEIEAGRFLLDDQGARPEQVDESALVAGQVADALLVVGNLAPVDAEALEEFVVEGLGLALFVPSLAPPFGERRRAGADFGPLQAHR